MSKSVHFDGGWFIRSLDVVQIAQNWARSLNQCNWQAVQDCHTPGYMAVRMSVSGASQPKDWGWSKT